MVDDCRHRDGHKCKKTGKTVALDMREKEDGFISCWDRMNCEFFEPFEEGVDKEPEPVNTMPVEKTNPWETDISGQSKLI